MSLPRSRTGRTRTLVEWCELELADKRHQLPVACGLAELPLSLRRIEYVFPLEVHRAHGRVRKSLNGDLLLFPNGKDDGLDGVVLAQLPDKELREVA